MMIKITATVSLRVMRYSNGGEWWWDCEHGDCVGATGGPYRTEDEAVLEGLREVSRRPDEVGRRARKLYEAELESTKWEVDK